MDTKEEKTTKTARKTKNLLSKPLNKPTSKHQYSIDIDNSNVIPSVSLAVIFSSYLMKNNSEYTSKNAYGHCII